MKIHPSALKHGVAAEDAEQAAEWALWIEPRTGQASLDSEDLLLDHYELDVSRPQSP